MVNTRQKVIHTNLGQKISNFRLYQTLSVNIYCSTTEQHFVVINMMSLRCIASRLALSDRKAFVGSYLQQYSSKQQLVVCIHTADLLLIEFLVYTKTSSMSTAASMSYSIALTSYDCLQTYTCKIAMFGESALKSLSLDSLITTAYALKLLTVSKAGPTKKSCVVKVIQSCLMSVKLLI